ncbi:MAG: hypothetical protein LR011_08030 [Verrucomicrobia bacterium]|nr:hypothetical protein [Verrucomicrobiota bacterium]
MKKSLPLLILLSMILTGCLTMKVDPIHITMDINVKVTKEVEKVFGELDEASTNLIDTQF